MELTGLRRATAALLTVVALLAAAAAGHTAATANPLLILISIDGFRWDYPSPYRTPNLAALAARGLHAREMIPSFPVLTFPNHYTIVTGLYPEHHGIVANTMVDPVMPVRFSMSNQAAVRDARWWGGEPIWVTAERHGLRSAAMFWPGTEAAIGSYRPSYWRPFDGKLPAASRTAQVLEWLALPEEARPSFVTLYFDDVDHAGHDFGPESMQLRDAVATVDRELGVLASGLRRLQLAERATIVVVSDHGMAPLSPSRVILLDDYIDTSQVTTFEVGGFLAMAPRDGVPVAPIVDRLRHASARLRIYTREDIPVRLHYSTNPRIAPIIGVPDPGWAVTTRAARQRRNDEHRPPEAGTHGYYPSDRVMHAIFFAAGPEIRRGLALDSVNNVDLYNFLCGVLKLTPAPNDGDPVRASTWLQHSH